MTFLPVDVYELVEQSVPIACVDFVPLVDAAETPSVGLILRRSPFGEVWCHLGGRVHRGETLADALRRHADDTLGVGLELPLNPQPGYVHEWFPSPLAPADGTVYGEDPRKHAIGLSFVVRMSGEPRARNEALDYGIFPVDRLPTPLWPGTAELLERLRHSM